VSETFAEAARRCCAVSAHVLGWRPGDFWGATPAELAMALANPFDPACPEPPARETIARMMERDSHE
jgi:hypothetical protein